MEATRENVNGSAVSETWVAWPVCWSAVWVGALSALAALVIFGLAGLTLGLHTTGAAGRIVDWQKVSIWTAACSVLSAFFAFVIGGWIAGKIGGYTRSEPAMLHGAIAWLVAVPALLVAAALGGASIMGSWYGGLAGSPSWSSAPAPVLPAPTDTAALQQLAREHQEAARAARNAALAAVTALLLGLMGSVLGGWMASGEPMTLTHHLRRPHRTGQHSSESEHRVLTHA
jgi:hypothetical protein